MTNINIKTFLEKNNIITQYCDNTVYGNCYSGLQNYGIIGTKIKNNLINLWKQIFINNSDLNIYEIETPLLLTQNVLKASGHIDKFYDYMITYESIDLEGKPIAVKMRADHLVEQYVENHKEHQNISVASFKEEDYMKFITDNKMVETNFTITKQKLMYEPDTGIYLRPETAQHIFLMFNDCKKYIKKESNFGLSQIGKSFRNEIKCRPFLRLAEFTMAEIEFFVNPKDPDTIIRSDPEKMAKIKTCTLPLYYEVDNHDPTINCMTVEEAYNLKLINTLVTGYFLIKVNHFAQKLGLKKYRFKKHNADELAHYSSECWDLEVFVQVTQDTSTWLECVGIADRGTYDLSVHKCFSNNDVKTYDTHYKFAFSSFKKDNVNMVATMNIMTNNIKNINDYFLANDKEMVDSNNDGDTIMIICNNNDNNNNNNNNEEKIMINKKYLQKIQVPSKNNIYVPQVIEPSFGIDRLLYCTLANSIHTVSDTTTTDTLLNKEGTNETRIILKLPKELRVYDVAIFQLSNKQELINIRDLVYQNLKSQGYSCYTDDSAVSIGKRYVRSDELGIEYAITIDFETISKNTVTIRTSDMKQVRIPIKDISLYLL